MSEHQWNITTQINDRGDARVRAVTNFAGIQFEIAKPTPDSPYELRELPSDNEGVPALVGVRSWNFCDIISTTHRFFEWLAGNPPVNHPDYVP